MDALPTDSPLLDQLVLGYSNLYNARSLPEATRLTVHSLAPTAHSDDATSQAHALVALLSAWWPAERGLLHLNLTSESALEALLATPNWPAHWRLEVPAFLAAQPASAERVRQAAAHGVPLVLKGRLPGQRLGALPAGLEGCFQQVIVDLGEAADGPFTAPAHRLPWVQSGATTVAQVRQGFAQGAALAHGWPQNELPAQPQPQRRRELPASVRVVMALLRGVDADEPPPRLEATLRADPALAFKLMRLINSPAFGLAVEINSFAHALMILGTQRLKRWLALLLASAVEAPDLKPLMGLAVRRGLLMEELARTQGDETTRSEAFICGVFSLLDQMLGTPFDTLLAQLPVAAGVAQTLGSGDGPHRAGLNLASAVEAELPHDILEASAAMLCSPAEVNRAVLQALVASQQLRAD